MKVEPVVLEGEVVRLEPMAMVHLDGLWEAGRDESASNYWNNFLKEHCKPNALRILQ